MVYSICLVSANHYHLPPITYHPLPITHQLPPIIHHPSLNTYQSTYLPTIFVVGRVEKS